jgi:hypothetical protein
LLIGVIAAVLLADKVSRITSQGFGFIGCAAGLLLASFATRRRQPYPVDLRLAVQFRDQPRP